MTIIGLNWLGIFIGVIVTFVANSIWFGHCRLFVNKTLTVVIHSPIV